MIGFAAERLMELEVGAATGAGSRSARCELRLRKGSYFPSYPEGHRGMSDDPGDYIKL